MLGFYELIKYFPDGNLLKARPKSGSSYTWQSILVGSECFKRGYIWRVEDGSQIKIWENCRIPSSHSLKILTPRGNNLVTNVEELINPVDGNWDEEMIRDMFWPVDIHRILQIPLVSGREDFVAWHFNSNDLFSVRSAYHQQWMHKFSGNLIQEQASGAGDEEVWGKLWQLQIPSKIKNFGWRVLHGALPCKGILANSHIENSSSCPACHDGCEDIKHLFTCNRAKEIWQRLWHLEEDGKRVLDSDRSGSVIVANLIKMSRPLEKLNHVGLAELILTGGWYI